MVVPGSLQSGREDSQKSGFLYRLWRELSYISPLLNRRGCGLGISAMKKKETGVVAGRLCLGVAVSWYVLHMS